MIESNFVFIDTQNKFDLYLPEIVKLTKCSLDVETTGLSPHSDTLLLLQIGTLDIQYIIDTRKVNILKLKPWLEDETKYKVGVNLAFDYQFLRHLGIQLEGTIDTYLHELMLNCGIVNFKTQGYFSLRGMGERYLGIVIDKEERSSFINFRGEFSEKQLQYAAKDIIYPLLILDKQKPKIIEHSLQKAVNLENNVLPSYGEIQYNGFYLDKNKWMDLIKYQETQANTYRKELDALFGCVTNTDLFGDPFVNYDSDEQLKPLIWKLGYKIQDTSHLTLMTELPKVISEPIIKYREAQKARNSFGTNFIDCINPITGRLHAHIFQIGAQSSRNSFVGPALQTVKREKEYRDCFTVQNEDNLILTSDYAGQELLCMIQNTKEPLWLRLNQEDKNIHLYMASEIIFQKEITKKGKEYTAVKNLDFATAYGCSFRKVQMLFGNAGITCTDDEAKDVLYRFATAVPTAWNKFNENGINTVINGYAASLIGFKRFFDKIPSYKIIVRDGLKTIIPKKYGDKEANKILGSIIREGRNHVIQSSGSGIVKASLYILRQKCKANKIKFPVVHVVHDELVNEFKEKDKNIYVPIIEQSMLEGEKVILPDVIPKLESSLSKKWEK